MVDGQMSERELRKLRVTQAEDPGRLVPRTDGAKWDPLTASYIPKSDPPTYPVPQPTPDMFLQFKLSGDMVQYAHDIRRFVDAMIYKLERNTSKGRWSGLSVDQAFELLTKEVEELRAEVGGNSIKNVLEAADVANFAMIIASIATERGK